MPKQIFLKICLALSVLGCAGLTVAGKAYKTEVAVTDEGAVGYFGVNVNTYATSLRAALMFARMKGEDPSSLEGIRKALPNFELPPRWEFTKEGRIGFQRNPYTNRFCKDTPNSDTKLHPTFHVTCKNGQIVIKEHNL